MTVLRQNGFEIHKGWLDRPAQDALVEAVRGIVAIAPFFRPQTLGGRPMRVRMTSAGRFGWYSDRSGYRYLETHPSGVPWPPIPHEVLAVWEALSQCPRQPESCLVNHYDPDARMGLHQDRDEADMDAPVVSISLGDPARFRMGGTARSDPTTSIMLESGDVVVMGGPARLAFHGVDRIYPGRSDLLKNPGRVNLTLRVVT